MSASLDFQIPSVDRPFGISLWSLFNTVASTLTFNKFIPSEFEFIEGETLLSTFTPVAIVITVYYFIIFGGQAIFNKFNLKPWKLNFLFQLHNISLTFISLTLLLLMIEQLIPIIYNHGLFYAICNKNAWTQPLVTLYFLNYLTKYLEFVDTLFLVVKRKKIIFLHSYHHGATALLCYTQLIGKTSISWVVISLNLAVHVVMYFYYFLAARGIRVWWKQWITNGQIIQFVLDLTFIYYAAFIKVRSDFGLFGCSNGVCIDCVGTSLATWAGLSIISSYLLLFILFYIDIYIKKGKKSRVVKRVGGFGNKVNEYVSVDLKDVATPSPSPAPNGRRSERTASPAGRRLRESTIRRRKA
ncbi:Elongation of fatty acids protein [Wickerhamomyces ciferrii]|uniref:Elongation of fatty acids protein n=1 Tax=Wickerhamomyces ciferrii (strain ATCC 14091 / BCRC 22168 / CBS 111 / JCM 3599 / NBRC 0793 / NRRL Y-1031 F-60-10) TaxID=1206466 RepID=K0KH77_WICCF|nr:Elongation of fatty acids protein [Wickerhamomyces ciferrii]CCH42346.1 Elongation of fatty acids protein [Wickerhamomyces ciferrii]